MALSVLSILGAVDAISLRGQVPSKYGHVFVAAPMTQDPFPRTTIMNSIVVGQIVDLDFGRVILPEGDTLVAFGGDVTVATLSFEYQHALRDWLAVWGGFEMGARLGTDVGSLFHSGVTMSTDLEFGWLVRLRETDRSVLSTTLTVTRRSHTVVDLKGWVADLLRSRLVRTRPVLRVGFGAHYAWVLNEVVAFGASGWAAEGDAVNSPDEQWYVTGALSMSVNLHPRYDVPLGAALTLLADSDPVISGALIGGWQGVGLRFAYTGRDDIMLSLTLQGQHVPFTAEEKINVVLGLFDIRYFF